METVFLSDELPQDERLARFSEMQVKSEHPMRVTSGSPDAFRARARALELTNVNVVELSCSPSQVLRTPRLIRDADPELWSVIFPLRGEVGVVQNGREAVLSPAEFALYDSSRPFQLHLTSGASGTPGASGASESSGTEPTALIRAHIPRTLLPLPAGAADRLLAVPLPGREGMGALLTQFLTRLTTESGAFRPADVPRLDGIASDLLGAVITHHLDAGSGGTGETPGDSGARVLLLRIEAFIQQHLHDTRLSPRTVAAAHHISVSYLHRLFEAHETTVAAWIRQQRLGRACRDLTDPALRTVPVSRIATRWGFNDHATFTRAFRGTHGIPPRDYRQQALDTAE